MCLCVEYFMRTDMSSSVAFYFAIYVCLIMFKSMFHLWQTVKFTAGALIFCYITYICCIHKVYCTVTHALNWTEWTAATEEISFSLCIKLSYGWENDENSCPRLNPLYTLGRFSKWYSWLGSASKSFGGWRLYGPLVRAYEDRYRYWCSDAVATIWKFSWALNNWND